MGCLRTGNPGWPIVLWFSCTFLPASTVCWRWLSLKAFSLDNYRRVLGTLGWNSAFACGGAVREVLEEVACVTESPSACLSLPSFGNAGS